MSAIVQPLRSESVDRRPIYRQRFWIRSSVAAEREAIPPSPLAVRQARFRHQLRRCPRDDSLGDPKRSPLSVARFVVGLLLASVGTFIALVHRITLLQVNHMLIFTGDQGRKVISKIYPALNSEVNGAATGDFRTLPQTQTLIHHGRPHSVQAVNISALVNLAKVSGGIIEAVVAVGDTVVESTPLLHVFGASGASAPVDERMLREGIELGEERTFEQDPK